MEPKLKYDANTILDREFSGSKNGYNTLEVDSFLDEIVTDYVLMEQYATKTEKRVVELEKESKAFKSKIEELEVENAVLNEKLKNVADNSSASLANIDLLKRISALEQAIYKLGKDPNEIK